MDVGIRELRADLSRWVRRVEQGEEIVVTDRGRAIARLVPMDGERKLDAMIRAGLVEPAPNKGPRAVPAPIEGAGPLSDLVNDGRG